MNAQHGKTTRQKKAHRCPSPRRSSFRGGRSLWRNRSLEHTVSLMLRILTVAKLRSCHPGHPAPNWLLCRTGADPPLLAAPLFTVRNVRSVHHRKSRTNAHRGRRRRGERLALGQHTPPVDMPADRSRLTGSPSTAAWRPLLHGRTCGLATTGTQRPPAPHAKNSQRRRRMTG